MICDANCPLKASDLTPLDIFLWGFFKAQVYAKKSKENLTQFIGQIQPDPSYRKLDIPNAVYLEKLTVERYYVLCVHI